MYGQRRIAEERQRHAVARGQAHDSASLLRSPKLRRFAAEQIEVRAEPSVAGSQAVVDVDLADGTTLAALCRHPLGSFENPLSRAQIEQKFRAYAKDFLPESHVAEVIGAVERLEEFGSIRRLMDLLRPAQRAMAAAE